jgi:uncharacterized membrane protein YvlD (DUF360 family)
MKTLISAALYIAANAIGLLIATLVLPDFKIDPLSFILVVVVFSVFLAVLTPAIRKISERRAPALLGGLSLIAIFVCLLVTSFAMDGFQSGGLVNLIGATVLVWIGSLLATLLLPRLLARSPTPKT